MNELVNEVVQTNEPTDPSVGAGTPRKEVKSPEVKEAEVTKRDA